MLTVILRFFYYLLLLFVVRSVFRWLFRRNLQRAGGAGLGGAQVGQPEREDARGSMVQDPVCGVYLDPALAVREIREGKTLYFCSSHCREAYTESRG